MKDLEQLKSAVRVIRNGGTVDGITIVDGILTSEGIPYKVMGSERLRLVEISIEDIVVPEAVQIIEDAREISPSAEETISKPNVVISKDVEEVCSECGTIFWKDKYHMYITKCPSCRVRIRTSGAVERTSTCSGCGIEYTISKFQPYLNTTQCSACTKKAAKARHLASRKARKEEIQKENINRI